RVGIADADSDQLRSLERSPVDILPVPCERCSLIGRRREGAMEVLSRDLDLEFDPHYIRLYSGRAQRNVHNVRKLAPGYPLAPIVECETGACNAYRLAEDLVLDLDGRVAGLATCVTR